MRHQGKTISNGRSLFVAAVFCVITAIASSAQTFTSLINFDTTTGGPPSSLVQGFDGELYGTTFTYGANGEGGAFKTTLQGGLLLSIISVLRRTAPTARTRMGFH